MPRPKWPVKNDDELMRDTEDWNAATIEERISRYRFILEEFGPPAGMFLMGGTPAMLSINEIQTAFIAGNFLSVVLLAQVFIEHSLGAIFIISGEDEIGESGFARLIEESQKEGSISKSLAKSFHKLREIRNPYTHPRVGSKNNSYMTRAAKSGVFDPYSLAEQDAREAVQTVVDFLRGQSPDFSPPED